MKHLKGLIGCLIFNFVFVGALMAVEEVNMRGSIEWQVRQQYRIEGHMEAPSDLPPWELKHWSRVVSEINNEEDMRVEP